MVPLFFFIPTVSIMLIESVVCVPILTSLASILSSLSVMESLRAFPTT